MEQLNGYDLSRKWFDWCFENPEMIKPTHTALYFFIIEHCNRLGWKQKFGLPTTMAKEALGIASYNTYINTLNDLVEFGFIKVIEKSKNQYSSNIVALSNFNKALDKALDKALIKHDTKQSESTSSINKQETIKQINNNTKKVFFKDSEFIKKELFRNALPDWSVEKLRYYYDALLTWSNEGNKKVDWIATAKVWERKDVAEGKVKFNTSKTELPKNWWNLDLTPEQWKLVPKEKVQEKENQDIRRKMGI
jgi:hypothetical protein